MANATRLNRWLLLAVIALAPTLGWLKVEQQRRHPPEWANKPAHLHDGYVSIDGHARRASEVRDILTGSASAGRKLRDELRTELHPSSLLVPGLVGVLSLATRSIPIAFLLYNLVVYAMTLILIGHLAARVCRQQGGVDVDDGVRWSLFVFASHVNVSRDVMQLHLDSTITCLGLATAAIALSVQSPSANRSKCLVAAGVQSLGVFTKASYFPFLAALPLATAFSRGREGTWRCAIIALAVPIACLVGYSAWLESPNSLARDLEHFADSWRISSAQFGRFLLEIGLAFQWFPLVIAARTTRRHAVGRTLLGLVGLYVSALLLFGLPSVPRLYMPAIALLCAVSAPSVLAHVARERAWQLYAWSLLNLSVAAAALMGP